MGAVGPICSELPNHSSSRICGPVTQKTRYGQASACCLLTRSRLGIITYSIKASGDENAALTRAAFSIRAWLDCPLQHRSPQGRLNSRVCSMAASSTRTARMMRSSPLISPLCSTSCSDHHGPDRFFGRARLPLQIAQIRQRSVVTKGKSSTRAPME